MLQVSASASGGPGRLRGTYLLGASERPPRFSPPLPSWRRPAPRLRVFLKLCAGIVGFLSLQSLYFYFPRFDVHSDGPKVE